MTATDPTEATRRSRRRRPGVTGVLGEVLITIGVVALLFVAWQLWIGDWIGAAEKNAAGASISRQWAHDFAAANTPATPAPTSSSTPRPEASPTPHPTHKATPVVLPEPGDANVFGVMYIPRFGEDYAVPMAGGVSRARTLDPIGIGHYPGEPMPGAIGNASFAAHRTTFGKPFNKIADLRLGDPIVIEVKQGWYVYRFRNLEYVAPDALDVLAPVPQRPGVKATGRYMTLTSCSPMYYKTERIVAYTVFDRFVPRADGPPEAIKDEGDQN